MFTRHHLCKDLEKINENHSFKVEVRLDEAEEEGGFDSWVLVHYLIATEEDIRERYVFADEPGDLYINSGANVFYCPYCGKLLETPPEHWLT